MSEAARNITEAVGGVWQGLNQPDPTFVPLDEFISQKFLEDFDRTAVEPSELVLDDAATLY